METFQVSNKSEHDAAARRKEEDVWNQSVSCVAVRRKWVLLKYEPTSCRWTTWTRPVDSSSVHRYLAKKQASIRRDASMAWRNESKNETGDT